MELITIIVPIYNVEQYLKQCIESLLQQSYKNIEIILVNDGSTDRSADICEIFRKKDNRIKVVNKSNEGLGYARNSGLKIANGKYVTFVDSDDYVDEDMIKVLYEAIIKNKSDTSLGGFKKINNDGKVLFIEEYKKEIFEGKDVYNKLFPKMLGSCPEKSDSIRMSVWNTMYSMDIIKENNIKFKSEREYISEDIIFDMEYYKYSNSVAIINESFYYYRTNNLSLTMKYKSDRFKLIKKLYKYIEEQLIKSNINSEVIYRAQRQFMINIRMCIKQENVKVSSKTIIEAIKNIKSICSDELVQDIIKKYPVHLLQLKPKIFIYLIKYKMSYLLYFLVHIKAF